MLDFNLEEIKTKVLSKNRKEPINPEGLSISSFIYKIEVDSKFDDLSMLLVG